MIKVVYFVSITLLIINLVFAIINFETLNLVLFISQSFVLFAIAVISNTAIKNEAIREETRVEFRGFRDYYFDSIKEKK
jgi:uncharacterized integral membrane protein